LISGDFCPDNSTNYTEFIDYQMLQSSLRNLRSASEKKKKTGEPFFINYGVFKPHLPFHFPAKFPGPDGKVRDIWEAYGPDDQIPVAKHMESPKGMPEIAFTYEMDGMGRICLGVSRNECYPIPGPNNATLLPGEKPCPWCGPAIPQLAAQKVRKAYYGAVSWVDHLVGQIVNELDLLGHRDDTVIAIVGDHGWQLGEHNIWGKHTNFELATRVPLIIRAPGQEHTVRTNALVESVDIYPTVASLAGLAPPADLDGDDLSSLWSSPNKPLKAVAFSEYPRCAPPDAAWTPEPGYAHPASCISTMRANFTIMGYSLRTDEWRCTFWLWWDGVRLVGDFAREPVAVELYAHAGDSEAHYDGYENENVAEANPEVVKQHFALAKGQWEKPQSSW